jgi:hypothetical protein
MRTMPFSWRLASVTYALPGPYHRIDDRDRFGAECESGHRAGAAHGEYAVRAGE